MKLTAQAFARKFGHSIASVLVCGTTHAAPVSIADAKTCLVPTIVSLSGGVFNMSSATN